MHIYIYTSERELYNIFDCDTILGRDFYTVVVVVSTCLFDFIVRDGQYAIWMVYIIIGILVYHRYLHKTDFKMPLYLYTLLAELINITQCYLDTY